MAITNPNNRPVVVGTEGTDGISVAIDYTAYYDRIATALETIATNSTTIKNDLASIKDDIDTIATQLTTVATQTTTIATQTTTVATQQTTIATKVSSLEDRAKNNGIKVLGPWEWLGLASIVKLYDEKNVDYNALKARVEQIPKSS